MPASRTQPDRRNRRGLLILGLRSLVRIRLKLATRDVVGVLLDIGVPFLRQVVQCKDRRNGADRNASAAVNAFDRVDEQLVHRIEPRPAIFVLRVLFRMNAIDRAGVHACSVFRSDAGFGNDKGHGALPKTAYLQLYHTGIAAAAPRYAAASEPRKLPGMDELSREVLKHFIAMGAESLDLHTLFEAGGNDPASRQRVLDVVTRLADIGYLESRGSGSYPEHSCSEVKSRV